MMEIERATSWIEAIRAVQSSAGGEYLLLVEDDEPTRQVMSRLMDEVGVKVIAVGTVKEAIEMLMQVPAVVVLDLMLPDGSGIDVLNAIREANLRCKVAVVSGYTDGVHFNQIREAKPDAVFSKPLNFVDFVDWLCEAFPETGGSRAAH
jgi:CheY-like chemotaxis protein